MGMLRVTILIISSWVIFHDEIQTEVKEEQAGLFGSLAVGSMIEAGTYYEMNCPLDAEFKVGDTWAETH